MTIYKHHNLCENISDSSSKLLRCRIKSSILSEPVNLSGVKHSKTVKCQYNICYYQLGRPVLI
jgi:hypothetical protein